jgi:diketogulonate reductase-like aldo/keto reductase
VNHLNEKAFVVLDELANVAKALDTSVARVSLSWVQNRPGVTSTIIGARTIKHLDDNLAALEVKLSPEQTAKLDKLTAPTLNFPAAFLPMAGSIQNGGTSVNGERMDPSPWGVTKKGEHY